MKTSHQKNLQSILLDPLQRSGVLLLPDALHECLSAGMHDTLQGGLSFIPYGNILPNIHEHAGFKKRFCSGERIREIDREAQFDNKSLQQCQLARGLLWFRAGKESG